MNMSKKFLQTSAITLGLGLAIASATTLCSSAAKALTLDLGEDVYGLLDNGGVNVLINDKDETIYADYKNISKSLVTFKPANGGFGNITWKEMLEQVHHWGIEISTDLTDDFGTEHVNFKVSPGDLRIKGVDNETVNDVLNKLTLTLENCNAKTLTNSTFKELNCTIKGSIAQ